VDFFRMFQSLDDVLTDIEMIGGLLELAARRL
jgi:hypothetical protein